MDKHGIILNTIRKICELNDLPVKVISYNTYFDKLWGLHKNSKFTSRKANEIWCVVDECAVRYKWFQISIWGRYFRANQPNPPNLILVSSETNLSPTENELSIPSDYKDPGIKSIQLTSKTFVVELLSAITEFTVNGLRLPQEGKINKWKRNIQKELGSDEFRHHISNEIAPILLRKSISTLGKKIDENRKRFIEKARENIQFDTISNSEGNALLKLWHWVNDLPLEFSSPNIIIPDIEDIWDLWRTKARFLLIDDQAEDHKYEDIVCCALELVANNEFAKLDFMKFEVGTPSLATVTYIKDKSTISDLVEKILANYDCILLDLRLNDADCNQLDYGQLTGVIIAKTLSEIDPSFPMILFTTSQKREIDEIFLNYKNVIPFRKPGIAGSSKAIDGAAAFNNLLNAIQHAIEMIENRLVYKKIKALSGKFIYGKRSLDLNLELKSNLVVNFLNIFYRQSYAGDYREAFVFPYRFLEEKFGMAALCDITVKNVHGQVGVTSLKNYNIECHHPEFARISGKFLLQLRNLASHYERDWRNFRREALITFLVLIEILSYENHSSQDYTYLGELNIENGHPLNRHYNNSLIDTDQCIYELFAALCYYTKSVSYRIIDQLIQAKPQFHGHSFFQLSGRYQICD